MRLRSRLMDMRTTAGVPTRLSRSVSYLRKQRSPPADFQSAQFRAPVSSCRTRWPVISVPSSSAGVAASRSLRIRKRSEGDKGNVSRCETVRPRSLVGDPSAGADQGLPPLDPALPFLPSPIRQGLLIGHCLRARLHHGPPALLSARM